MIKIYLFLKKFYHQNKIIQNHVNKFIEEEMERRKFVREDKSDLMIAFYIIEKKDTVVFLNLTFNDGSGELVLPSLYNSRDYPKYLDVNKIQSKNTRYHHAKPEPTLPYERVVKYSPVKIKYLEGALVIDLINTKDNSLIWRGWAIDTLCEGYSIDPKAYENKIEYHLKSNIHKILARSPLPRHKGNKEWRLSEKAYKKSNKIKH
jgi:hypothetical protein